MTTTVEQMNTIITNYISALSDKEQLRFISNSLKIHLPPPKNC